MRVLMTTMQLDIGGAETHIVELSKALARRGVEVFVASNGGAYEKELQESGITHFSVPLNSKNPIKMERAYRKLKKIISEYKFDVVHGHARIPSFLCGKLKKQMGFPFVTTAHWVFRAGFPFNLLSDWGERSLAVSEDIKKYLIDSYGVKSDNIRVTINGIDTEKFSKNTDFSDIKAEFGLGENKRRIVYVSRMDTDRSLVAHQLIEITKELYRDFPDLEIVIVGGGNDFEAVKAEAQAVNDALSARVIITTGARTDINKFAASGDIFVGVSRAALEAMACEKPAIIAGNEGYIGIFDEEKLGVSIDTNFCCRGCEPSTPKRLAQDIRALFEKRDLKALGEYSREVIKQRYSVETMADDALKMYTSVLTGGKINECEEMPLEELLKYSLPYGKGIKNDVVISGYYGFKNHGDDTTLKAIIGGLKAKSPNIRITVLSKNPSETRRIYGVDAINRLNIFAAYRKMKQSSLLISGGGSLIQDVTSGKSLSYYLLIIKLAQRAKIKTMLYGNGVGPVLNEDKFPKIAKILNRVDAITLREPGSLKTLSDMGVDTKNASVTADAVFSLTTKKETSKNTATVLKYTSGGKYFCVSVRSWDYLVQDFEKTVARVCEYVYETYKMTPVFIPMQPSRDNGICERIMKNTKAPSCLIDSDNMFDEFMGIIAGSEFIIGMRLHILIYAACAGVPVIGLEYDPKVKNMMEYMGQNHSISVQTLDFDGLCALCDDILKNRDEIAKKLVDIRSAASAAAEKNSEIAIKLLKA